MSIRIAFRGKQTGPKLEPARIRWPERAQRAIQLTAQEAREELLERGREDIANAGNFGSRWIDGLGVSITGTGPFNQLLSYFHRIPFAAIHETGGTIQGKPLLWIPLSHTGLLVRARDYPGRLFRVDRLSGAPLLLDARTREPLYFGKERVTLPKRFNLRKIAAEVARGLGATFRKHMRADRG